MSDCLITTPLLSLSELESAGSSRIGDTRSHNDEPPEWYDSARFRRGQLFFQRHLAALAFAMHCSLTAGFSIRNLLEPLVFTRQSDTPRKAYKRYMLTFDHIYQWMTGDLWDEKSKAYKSMAVVKGMHSRVAKSMNEAYMDKVHVSQYDMALVQYAFFGFDVSYPEKFGIHCTDAELGDYVYVWRVIGYRLGIEDKFNICSGSLAQTRRISKEIELQCLIPALEAPPKDFDVTVDSYIAGVNTPFGFPLYSKSATLAIVRGNFETTSPPKLNLADAIRFRLLCFVTWLTYHASWFERLRNRVWLGVIQRETQKILTNMKGHGSYEDDH